MIRHFASILAIFFCMQFAQAHRMPFKPFELKLGASKGFLLEANATQDQKPWVWYAASLPAHPNRSHTWYIDRFLAKGISLAGCDQEEVRGSLGSVEVFRKFYQEMLGHGYSKKPVLLGQSRGGLMLLCWAVRNPKRVGGFAGIYPVLDLRSWPIKRNLGSTLADFGMDQDTFSHTIDRYNPINNLEGLALRPECPSLSYMEIPIGLFRSQRIVRL